MALKTRAMLPQDLNDLWKLHEKYYSHLEFPDWRQCKNIFIIEDEKKEIVTAGFIEPVAEAMLVTNKAKSVITIGKALVEAQKVSMFTCARLGIKDLYAFVDEETYAKHLIKHGFIEANRALKLRIS